MKILIIKLSALGDVLATTPFFRLLKEAIPNAEVHHLVMKHCSIITENNPYVDKQIIVDMIPSNSRLKDSKNILLCWIKIIQEKYDIAVIFHRNFTFQLLCKLSGIKKLIGFSSTCNWWLDNSITYGTTLNRTIQEHKLLSEGGICVPIPIQLEFYPDKKKIDDRKLSNLPIRYLACNPGGGNPHAPADNRIWPVERYAEIIQSIDLPVVILGNGENDQKIAEKLSSLTSNGFINLVNQTNLHETALILKNASLYLGNDSSLLFLAAALDTITLGLFGPTQIGAANPIGKKQYYIEGVVRCAPCYNPYDGLNGAMYICKNNICMQNILSEDVFSFIQKLLKVNNDQRSAY